jgi:MarR family transcriptional regulator, 2-MHQ and catechol-resistance regulon repressor
MASTQPSEDLLDHPDLTTAGLLVEAHAGLAAATQRKLDAEHALSGQWFEVLIRLVRSPGHRLRMSDLAAQTTLSASGLTRVVDRLAEQGLVRREACPSDRRGAFAALSEDGEARIIAAVPMHVAQLSEIFSVLSPDELRTLSDLLRKLRDSVNPCAAHASELGCPEGDERG